MAALFATGCSFFRPDPGYVMRAWAQSMRELGIVSVFPPREDFQVGDVFIYDKDIEDLEILESFDKKWTSLSEDQRKTRLTLGMSTRTMRLDLHSEIDEEYAQTFSAPKTSVDQQSLLDDPAVQTVEQVLQEKREELTSLKTMHLAGMDDLSDEIDAKEESVEDTQALFADTRERRSVELYSQPDFGEDGVFTGEAIDLRGKSEIYRERLNRFRLVAFPQFSSVTFTQSDLSALIPIEAMKLGLDVSRRTVDQVNVSVPAAESYGLSTYKIVEEMLDESRKLKPRIQDAISFKLSGTDSTHAYVHVISEVFYARALDVSLYSGDSFGLLAQLSSPVVPEAVSDDPAALEESEQASLMSEQKMVEMREQVGVKQEVPGGSVQVLSFSNQSIGLRRLFDRPVAIGYRGFVIRVEQVVVGGLNTWQIVGVKPIGGAAAVRSEDGEA
ncbi:MAG: hypothetical protein AAF212_05730 [Verrucomicrobiota bacterium]